MNAVFKTLASDRTVLFSLVAATILVLLHSALLVATYTSLPPFLPIFNQMPWGQERLGTKLHIFIPLALSLSFLGGNSFTCALLYKKLSSLSARVYAITTLLLVILSFLFTIRTILVVT